MKHSTTPVTVGRTIYVVRHRAYAHNIYVCLSNDICLCAVRGGWLIAWLVCGCDVGRGGVSLRSV